MSLKNNQTTQKKQHLFSGIALDIIKKYGRLKNAKQGTTEIFFGKKEYQKTISELKRAIQLMDKVKDKNLLITENMVAVFKWKTA